MKILGRDEFINEIYNPMMEEKEYRELQAINEGLLKNLFGKLKNALGFTGWKKIKGNQDIIKIYKEMDEKLTGYTTMKFSKADKCDQIRQELVNFAETWYDFKMENAKKNDSDPKIAKSMEFKDENLKENLENCKNNIKDIADGDNQMVSWSNLLLNNMKNVINNVIIKDIEDEKTRKEIEEQEKKDQPKIDKLNKKMEELQNEELTEIDKARKDLINATGATPIEDGIYGDKAIQNIWNDFRSIPDALDIITNNVKVFEESNEGENNDDSNKQKRLNELWETIEASKLLGFSKIYDKEDVLKENHNGELKLNNDFNTAMIFTKAFFSSLNDRNIMAKFESTPGASVQAMCISVISFIKYCVYGGSDYGKNVPLMAKCAIVSNGTASFNLPMNDDEKEPGNFFTDTIAHLLDGSLVKNYIKTFKDLDKKEKDSIKKNEEIQNIVSGKDNNFAKNAQTLKNKIKSDAKKELENAIKAHDDKVKNFNLDLDKEFSNK